MNDWSEAKDASGTTYYYNAITQESRWEKPGEEEASSAATPLWAKHLDAASGNHYYVNANTQETTWDKPDEEAAEPAKADAEEPAEADAEEPAESGAAAEGSNADDTQDGGEKSTKDDSDWVEKVDGDSGRTYYSNKNTGETQWWFDPRKVEAQDSSSSGPPSAPSMASAVLGTWLLTKDAAGREYYYNSKTQETRWDKPEEVRAAAPAPPASAGASNPLGAGAGNALSAGQFHNSAAYSTSHKRARTEEDPAWGASVPQADQLDSVLGRIDASGQSQAQQAAAEAAGPAHWTPHQLIEQERQQAQVGPQYKDYSTTASFNSKTAGFDHAGDESYYERNNIPADREGRQMSNFFDLNNLQANREQYKEMKKKRQNMKGVDWKKYKEKKKKERAKKRNAWLLED